MFYDFTEVYHVNVFNALQLANQSVHYIGFKHKPYIINVCKWYFYYRELDRARTSPSLVNLFNFFSARDWVEFNKSCNLIGS